MSSKVQTLNSRPLGGISKTNDNLKGYLRHVLDKEGTQLDGNDYGGQMPNIKNMNQHIIDQSYSDIRKEDIEVKLRRELSGKKPVKLYDSLS